jgi:hypothetical protein
MSVFYIVLRNPCYYFPVKHRLIGVRKEMECVYSAVGNESLNTIQSNKVLRDPWAYENM